MWKWMQRLQTLNIIRNPQTVGGKHGTNDPSKPLLLLLSLQSCPTLCDPTDGSPPGSPVPGILQARTLEWVAISFSSAWKRKVKVTSLSPVRPSATPWTAAYQAPPSMGFSRQEYWSGVPFRRNQFDRHLDLILLASRTGRQYISAGWPTNSL